MKFKTIILLLTMIVILLPSPAAASDIESRGSSRASILSWSPPVVGYVYVNDTVNRTVTYSITTSGQITENNWTLDGAPVKGIITGNTVSYVHTWEKRDAGFHTLTFGRSENNAQTAFRWYVNVYETGQYGGGNLFDVIDDVLENHATDIKIRMLKYTIEKHGSGSDLTAMRIKRLHNEITEQRNFGSKYNIKLAKEVAKIARDDMKDERLADMFNKLSETENGQGRGDGGTDADNGKDTGSNNANSDNKKSASSGSTVVSKDGSESPKSGGGSGSSGITGNNGKSKISGNSANSKTSGSSGSLKDSGNSESNGDSQNSGKSKNSGKSEDNGGLGNSGSSGSSGSSGDSENSGSSGTSKNSGGSKSSGGSGDGGNTGSSGGTGNNGDKGNSGNNGNSGKDKK